MAQLRIIPQNRRRQSMSCQRSLISTMLIALMLACAAGAANEKNLAHIWLDPKRDFAMVLVTNIGGAKANEALFALAPALYARLATPKSGR
jgi:hypothetical protein